MKREAIEIQKTKNQIRPLQRSRRKNEFIQASSNDSGNNGKLTLNLNISNEIDAAITKLNILEQQFKNNGQQSTKQRKVRRSTRQCNLNCCYEMLHATNAIAASYGRCQRDNNIYNNEKKKIMEAFTINLAQWSECDANVYLC